MCVGAWCYTATPSSVRLASGLTRRGLVRRPLLYVILAQLATSKTSGQGERSPAPTGADRGPSSTHATEGRAAVPEQASIEMGSPIELRST